MDRRAAWVLSIIFGGLFLSLFAFFVLLYAAVRGGAGHEARHGDQVGILEIKGPITESKRTLKQLRELDHDESVKDIVVRIDSPGGAVGPSQEIYDALMKLRKTKKVIVSMGATAASGGFYIACAGDRIFADPGTLTGSIGVIFQIPNLTGLSKWAGVSVNTLKAGKMKDIGNMFRPMTPEEKSYLEGVLEDVHQQFIEAVAKGRGLPVSQITPIADGRVFTGRQAKDLKLVDELGGLDAAVDYAGKIAGIHGEPHRRYPTKGKRFLKQLLGDEDEDLDSMFQGASAVSKLLSAGGLQYRLPLGDLP